MQPVIDQAAALAIHRGGNAAAAIMADHHDMLDLQHIDGELQHRKIIGVLGRGQIGDIAMDEQLAGIQIDDLIGRHAAVGAADPEIFRGLLARQPAEEIRIRPDDARGPGPVSRFQILEHACALRGSVAAGQAWEEPERSSISSYRLRR